MQLCIWLRRWFVSRVHNIICVHDGNLDNWHVASCRAEPFFFIAAFFILYVLWINSVHLLLVVLLCVIMFCYTAICLLIYYNLWLSISNLFIRIKSTSLLISWWLSPFLYSYPRSVSFIWFSVLFCLRAKNCI